MRGRVGDDGGAVWASDGSGGARGSRRRRVASGWAWIIVAVCSGCATTGGLGEGGGDVERPARVVVAEALAAIDPLVGGGDPVGAGLRLAEAWARADELEDDRVLRAALRALPESARPPALAGAREIERAFIALEGGRRADARAALATAGGHETVRDALRLVVLRALSGDARANDAALARAANTTPTSSLTRELASLARLTLASRALDGGDLKRAIAEFLRIEPHSGHWRAARFGLAMCQLRAGRDESALKVLALLPGGLVAEPERALVAAMAAHGLRLTEEARAIVDGALARRERWEVGLAWVDEVVAELDRLASGGGLPADESLVTLVASTPSVAAADGELRAARAEAAPSGSGRDPMARYAAALERERDAVIGIEGAAVAARASRAFEDLAALRPQLR